MYSILHALEIKMTSNTCNFMGRHFTQVDGATTDICRAGNVY